MQLPAHTNPSPCPGAGIPDGFPQGGIGAFKLIDNELRRVKNLIDRQLTSSNKSVRQIFRTSRVCSGKMLRPGLVLLAGRCFGRITDKHIRIAAVVEMIHNATLLHDDVIDEGQKRRGLPTVNNLRGNESAILLGDYLLGRVFKMCIDLEPEIIRIIAATTMRICEGELSQITERQNWQLSEPEYISIITEKTAALFSSSCSLGASLAGADEKQIQSLADFGRNFGIAFQITDDLNDIIGEESKAGKTLGSDASKNKLTLPMIHLLGVEDEEKRDIVKSRLSSAAASISQRARIVRMLMSKGSLEYAYRRAQEFVTKAIKSLDGLKKGDAKDALIEVAKFISIRVV